MQTKKNNGHRERNSKNIPSKFLRTPFSEESCAGLPEDIFDKPSRAFNKKSGTNPYHAFENQLLQLREALSEKELQLGELRAKYNFLIAKSAEAHQNWEEAVRTKDCLIQQLRASIKEEQYAAKRKEKLIQEATQKLHLQSKSEKNELARKDLEIAFLKAKNVQQARQLADQQTFCGRMKMQQQDRNELVSYSQTLERKVEKLDEGVQDLEIALERKEEEIKKHKKQCEDLKVLVWEREHMVIQLQHVEEKLQSTLKRQMAAYEALERVKNKTEDDKIKAEKRVEELQDKICNFEASALENERWQESLEFQEACIKKQRWQLCELQKALSGKEAALREKMIELQNACKENRRISEDFDILRQEYEVLKQEYGILKDEKDQLLKKLFDLKEYDEAQIGTTKDNAGQSYVSATIARKYCYNRERRKPLPNNEYAALMMKDQEPCQDTKECCFPTQLTSFERDKKLLHNKHHIMSKKKGISHASIEHELEGVGKPVRINQTSLKGHSQSSKEVETWIETNFNRNNDPLLHIPSFRTGNSACSRSDISRDICVGGRDQDRVSATRSSGFHSHKDFQLPNAKTEPQNCQEDLRSNTSLELKQIQEEIQKREKRWKHTEAKMRAELSRRMAQIQEVEQDYLPLKQMGLRNSTKTQRTTKHYPIL